MKIQQVIIFAGLILFSCSKDQIRTDPDNLLIGTWNYSDYHNDASVYKRSKDFIDNHCYKFNQDGTLVERKINGWCGTPPVTWANYDGNWTQVNDTIIRVQVGYWGGETTYKLDIETISSDSLVLVTTPD